MSETNSTPQQQAQNPEDFSDLDAQLLALNPAIDVKSQDPQPEAKPGDSPTSDSSSVDALLTTLNPGVDLDADPATSALAASSPESAPVQNGDTLGAKLARAVVPKAMQLETIEGDDTQQTTFRPGDAPAVPDKERRASTARKATKDSILDLEGDKDNFNTLIRAAAGAGRLIGNARKLRRRWSDQRASKNAQANSPENSTESRIKAIEDYAKNYEDTTAKNEPKPEAVPESGESTLSSTQEAILDLADTVVTEQLKEKAKLMQEKSNISFEDALAKLERHNNGIDTRAYLEQLLTSNGLKTMDDLEDYIDQRNAQAEAQINAVSADTENANEQLLLGYAKDMLEYKDDDAVNYLLSLRRFDVLLAAVATGEDISAQLPVIEEQARAAMANNDQGAFMKAMSQFASLAERLSDGDEYEGLNQTMSDFADKMDSLVVDPSTGLLPGYSRKQLSDGSVVITDATGKPVKNEDILASGMSFTAPQETAKPQMPDFEFKTVLPGATVESDQPTPDKQPLRRRVAALSQRLAARLNTASEPKFFKSRETRDSRIVASVAAGAVAVQGTTSVRS